MTNEQRERLTELCKRFRNKHGGSAYSANTLHAGWDVVFDAEALMEGRRAIISDPVVLIECLERYES